MDAKIDLWMYWQLKLIVFWLGYASNYSGGCGKSFGNIIGLPCGNEPDGVCPRVSACSIAIPDVWNISSEIERFLDLTGLGQKTSLDNTPTIVFAKSAVLAFVRIFTSVGIHRVKDSRPLRIVSSFRNGRELEIKVSH